MLHLSPVARPAFLLEEPKAHFLRAAPDRAVAPPHRVADKNSSCFAAPAADLRRDSGRPRSSADRRAVVPVQEPSCGSSDPIHFAVEPSHCPNAHPSAEANLTASHGSTQVAADSSARVLAE